MIFPSSRPLNTARRRILGLAIRVVVWALIGFHALLFAQRLADLSIVQPAIAAQWLATVVLLAWGWRHLRRGGSLVAGRSALAFWILVLVLHAFALQPSTLPVAEEAPTLLKLLAFVSLVVLVGLTAPVVSRSHNWTGTGHQRPTDADPLHWFSGRAPPALSSS